MGPVCSGSEAFIGWDDCHPGGKDTTGWAVWRPGGAGKGDWAVSGGAGGAKNDPMMVGAERILESELTGVDVGPDGTEGSEDSAGDIGEPDAALGDKEGAELIAGLPLGYGPDPAAAGGTADSETLENDGQFEEGAEPEGAEGVEMTLPGCPTLDGPADGMS